MAKLFGSIPNPFSGPPLGEPRLHFWRLKKQLGRPPVAWEHLVIPKSALAPELRKEIREGQFIRGSWDAVSAYSYAKVLPPQSLREALLVPAIAFSVTAPIRVSLMKLHQYTIKRQLVKGLEKESLPFTAAYEPTEEGYKQVTSARLMQQMRKMTHGMVDNAGNIILLKHPLEGLAKAQGFGERWANLKKWVAWNQPLHRTRFKLRKPRRIVRVKVPKPGVLARLASHPMPQALKPAPIKNIRAQVRRG